MTTWEQLFADASPRKPRRPFDAGAGLRRLAQDAGYTPPAPAAELCGPYARRRLVAMSRLTVTQAGAAVHIEELSALLGEDETAAQFDGWTEAVDIEGVQVFACMLYLAHHPESARFWWKFAAGAGHVAAAYCLHLDHLSLGDDPEARFWKRQISALARRRAPQTIATRLVNDSDPETILRVLESVIGRAAWRTVVPTSRLEAEVERLVGHHDDGLVCRPAPHLTDRIHDLAART